ncbi:MAG: helix-turn-helix transcriptional regulator [Microbacteriaceae bacterium]|nr:helix-turn-helix transcriptional regulator [Microbacteriaceae bacterium]
MPHPRSYGLEAACPVSRSLTVLGRRWTLLLLREAFLGKTRFAEFSRIGIPSDVLAARLQALVDEGLFERRPYQSDGERARDEYVLTDAGRSTLPIIAALAAWGDEHVPSAAAEPMRFLDGEDGRPLTIGFTDGAGRAVEASDVLITR